MQNLQRYLRFEYIHSSEAHRIHRMYLLASFNAASFRKKHYKYLHSFGLHLHNILLLNSIPSHSRLKQPCPIYKLAAILLQKLIKKHQKPLTNPKGNLEPLAIQKVIPLRPQLDLDLGSFSWRFITTRLALKKLSFDLSMRTGFDRIDWQGNSQQIREYKLALSRSLGQLKNLESLDIQISSQATPFLIFLLGSIRLHSISLKRFSLVFDENFECSHSDGDGFIEKKSRIRKMTEHVNILKVSCIEWFSILISAGKFKKLYHLKLKIMLFPEREHWNFEYLSRLQELIKLEKFIFTFDANYVPCENEFFSHFTLPPTLKEFSFTLRRYAWNKAKDNLPSNPEFFEKLKGNQRLENLYLTFNSYLADKFACLFIQCFTKLKRVHYQNGYSYNENLQDPPLHLEEFWKALEPSKRTLFDVKIDAAEVIFPKKTSVLNTEFPKLYRLDLGRNIECAAKFGIFCQSFPSLNQVDASGLKFTRKKRLRKFLEDFKEIPLKTNIVLKFDVECIRQEFLIDCLVKFIKEANIEGNLEMYFKNVQVDNQKSFGELMHLALEKGCFWRLQMEMENSDVLFWVQRQRIGKIKKGWVLKNKG